jgi:PD-(D/E)XK endonuclease
MARLKTKGDLAELKVAADLLRRGFRIAIPFGEDCDYDLICDTGEELHRIQVKHATSDGAVCEVHCMSHSLTNGKVRQTKRYTAETIDWLAVYDRTTERCFYIPAIELGAGRSSINIRLSPARNGQRAGINFAKDYEDFPALVMLRLEMEPAGLEPAPSGLQSQRSSN